MGIIGMIGSFLSYIVRAIGNILRYVVILIIYVITGIRSYLGKIDVLEVIGALKFAVIVFLLLFPILIIPVITIMNGGLVELFCSSLVISSIITIAFALKKTE